MWTVCEPTPQIQSVSRAPVALSPAAGTRGALGADPGGVSGASAGRSLVSSAAAESLSDVERPAAEER